jgi:hypothetical protein
VITLIGDRVHPSFKPVQDRLESLLMQWRDLCTSLRTPLAMRTFRPRPIRLFEPLLVEALDPVKKEHRELKRELREDRKRVVRHIQAEAGVERRAREKEVAADTARRQEKYVRLMADLQSQQHVMKTVDAHMAKARSKKKKSISGTPKDTSKGPDN